MFSSNFIGYHYNKITLKDTDLTAFKSVLNYIYTGNWSILNKIKFGQLHGIDECDHYYKVDAFVKKAQKLQKKQKVVSKNVINGLSEVRIVEGSTISVIDSTVASGIYLRKNRIP
uniref:BTB domain-containing protein n=1 Tax=Panagrellus redivivus TaxID=6233 RepID=A0A7E4V302_PANRE